MTVTIESNLCSGCSKCSKVCPLKVIIINHKKVAEVIRPDDCAHCFHCMSICPSNAISGDFIESRLGKKIDGLDLPSLAQVENFILTRRSIRAYSNKNVEQEKIKKLLKIASHAPTARNAQNVQYIVVGPEKNHDLELLLQNYFKDLPENLIGTLTREAGYKILLGSPLTIAFYADKWNDEEDLNESLWNCLISAQTLLLAAHGFGLGGCYNGLLCLAYRNEPKVDKFFNLPEGKKIYMFASLGYPEEGLKYLNIINRKKPEIKWI